MRWKKMSEEEKDINTDSINWGSASKDGARKIYGEFDKAPNIAAKKIEIANILNKFALGQINREVMEAEITSIKEHYDEGK